MSAYSGSAGPGWSVAAARTGGSLTLVTEPISRRQAAKLLALGLSTPSLLAACAGARAGPSRATPRVARVRVSPERVIREVAGLRPFRRPGFLVSAEAFDDNTLIHNYGHGGGGLSLSWGSAHLAAELARQTEYRDVAIVGCGALGLSTARLLQDRGFNVTIYARDLPPHTTSNIAGAQWAPVSVAERARRTAAFDAQFVAASRFAHRYFQTLVGARYGISWRENYFLSDRPPQGEPPWESALLPDLLRRTTLPAEENPFGFSHVTHFLSMHIEPSIYLAAVLADFRLAGGRVVVRTFSDRRQLAELPHRLVINCTGLGAATLFDDKEMMPIKGQLVVLAPQPEVDYITVGPGDLYMMPRQDGIVLGGTYERGVSTLEPNPAESARILRGHEQLFARMR